MLPLLVVPFVQGGAGLVIAAAFGISAAHAAGDRIGSALGEATLAKLRPTPAPAPKPRRRRAKAKRRSRRGSL